MRGSCCSKLNFNVPQEDQVFRESVPETGDWPEEEIEMCNFAARIQLLASISPPNLPPSRSNLKPFSKKRGGLGHVEQGNLNAFHTSGVENSTSICKGFGNGVQERSEWNLSAFIVYISIYLFKNSAIQRWLSSITIP